MFNNNQHLNIFEHFSQKDALPIENNVSRGLAILLNENTLLFDRVIDLINSKCVQVAIPKPQRKDDFDVGIQQTVKSIVEQFPNPQTLIGMTLTTSKPVQWKEQKAPVNGGYIIDIVVRSKDTLIIIEVKRNAIDARAQLEGQIDSLVEEIVNKKETPPQKELVDGTWEEVIGVLQDVHNLSNDKENSILGHYLKHLENRYQAWFPVALLSEIDLIKENEVAIEKRIVRIMENCCDNPDDKNRYSGRYIIPLDYNFLSEAQINIDYDKKCLMITVWPGDLKWQGYNLFNNTANDLSWIYSKELVVQNNSFEMLTQPYLRLAHFQSSIVIEYLDEAYYKQHFGTEKGKCMELFKDITKEWNRDDWNELIATLTTKYSGLIDSEHFLEQFGAKFENSKRGYAHVSFGYETTVYIPFDTACKCERSGGTEKKQDKLAMLISETLDNLIGKIK